MRVLWKEGRKQPDWLRPPLGKVISVGFLDALPPPTLGASGLKRRSGAEDTIRGPNDPAIPGFGQITRHA